jgi:hypothetical protein
METKICPLYKLAILMNWRDNQGYGHEICDGRECAWFDNSNYDCSIKSVPYLLDRIAVK